MRLFLVDFENRKIDKSCADKIKCVSKSDSQLQLKNNVPMQSQRQAMNLATVGTVGIMRLLLCEPRCTINL